MDLDERGIAVEARARRVVAAVLGIPEATVGPTTSQDTVGAWDSLRTMNLILALEEAFGITIPDEDAAHLTSFPIVVLTVLEQLGEPS